MTKTVKLTIKSRSVGDVDAPTVDDLLSQVRDLVDILKSVETAITDKAASHIDWRVTDASRTNPITFEITPYPEDFATNIDALVEDVTRKTATGINTLASGAERPTFFNDKVIGKAEKLFKRVTNGLESTSIDFGDNIPRLEMTTESGMSGVKNISALRTPTDFPYIELGSVEGFIHKVERDGYKRPVLHITTRLDGHDVKCIAKGDALRKLGNIELGEVWKGVRVLVYGTLKYKALGKLELVEADAVSFYETDDDLPSHRDIVDPDFTKGVETTKFLEELRRE